ncbi:MAG: ribose 5-phosphate isomerase B [Bacteriovoracaceae bacterium]
MKVYIGSDHAGFKLKSLLLQKFEEGVFGDYTVENLGTNSDESCHYPEFAKVVAEKVQGDKDSLGILVCGSGIGVSMVANRFKSVRAALCRSSKDAEMSRLHNNSNVICLGERFHEDFNEAVEIVKTWLSTSFEGGRHQGRVDLFDSLGEG